MTNFREGSRRIKIVGQVTAVVAVILAVCVVVIQLHMPTFVYLLAALLTFAKPALAGLVLWALGWIMEGFNAAR
jgi:hypothetical protein